MSYTGEEEEKVAATLPPPPPRSLKREDEEESGPPSCASALPIPMFALHPRGSFYVPLSVDRSVVDPFLDLFDTRDDDDDASAPAAPAAPAPAVMLHPVTINVNFCGPVAAASASPAVKVNNNIPSGSSQQRQQHLLGRT